MIAVSVLYPKTESSRFDHEYYTGRHMPMVKKYLSGLGLERVELLRGTAGLDGGPASFELLGVLSFSSAEAMASALAAHGAEIMGDIQNFTDVTPLIQINEPLDV